MKNQGLYKKSRGFLDSGQQNVGESRNDHFYGAATNARQGDSLPEDSYPTQFPGNSKARKWGVTVLRTREG